jgi:hypothetical protein
MNGAFNNQDVLDIRYADFPVVIARTLDYIEILVAKDAKSTHTAWELINQNVYFISEGGKEWRAYDITKDLNEIEPLSVVDNVKHLFETCTDDLQNTNVSQIMETFQRRVLRAFRDYGTRQRDLFIQLEPIIGRTRATISLLENDTDVVKAKQRITDIFSLFLFFTGVWSFFKKEKKT